MTYSKYLISLFIVLLSSCGNNPSDVKDPNTIYTDKPIDSVKEIVTQPQTHSDLITVWTNFQIAISSKDKNTIRQLSLDSLQICYTTYSVTKFLNQCFQEVFDTTLLNKFAAPKNINQIDIGIEPGYLPNHVLSKVDYSGNIITLKQFQIVKELTQDGAWTMTFDFIRTKQGYKFFGCDSYGGPQCCR